MEFNFDRIYVIQSLDSQREILSGEILYNDVIRYFDIRYNFIKTRFFSVQTIAEFERAMSVIADESEGHKPIIHFELHGSRDGFDLVAGKVDWGQIYRLLTMVNIACKFNLLITTAVCYSNFAISLLLPTLPAAYKGIIGSFEEILDGDAHIQYVAFYNELLSSLNFASALQQFYLSNPGISAIYKVLTAEQVFMRVYQRFLDESNSLKKLRQRFEDNLATHPKKGEISLAGKEQLFRDFVKAFLNGQSDTFTRYKKIFFMCDLVEENCNNFCKGWEPTYVSIDLSEL